MGTDTKGFTLFEMLLSISLTGFVMLALMIGLRVASRAWRSGEARLRQTHAAAERNALILQQISSLVPYQVTSTDPRLPETFIVIQGSATCLRFVSSYSSAYRSRSGLVLAEYGIVEASPDYAEVALRETAVGDDDALFHRLVQNITNDTETGATLITYQPFLLRATDLVLMTGLRAAWFEYLDLHPEKGGGPVWLENWKGREGLAYPEAIRLRWERANQAGEEVIPVRAKPVPPSPFGQ